LFPFFCLLGSENTNIEHTTVDADYPKRKSEGRGQEDKRDKSDERRDAQRDSRQRAQEHMWYTEKPVRVTETLKYKFD
jgi:hypothetical protein